MPQYRIPRMRGVPFRFPRRSGGVRGRGRFRLWPLVIFAVAAIIYYQVNQKTVPVTGRSQLVDMTKQQEVALGLQSYNQILSKSKVISASPEVDMIRRIGKRLAAVTDENEYQWEFNLIDTPEPNAFALPGGKVGINTGILPIAKNEDGLAVIMGHEIAHAIARHGAERMAHERLAQWGTMAVGMSVSEMDPQTQQMVLGALVLGLNLGYGYPFQESMSLRLIISD